MAGLSNVNFVGTWVSIGKVEHKYVDTGVASKLSPSPCTQPAASTEGPGWAFKCFLKRRVSSLLPQRRWGLQVFQLSHFIPAAAAGKRGPFSRILNWEPVTPSFHYPCTASANTSHPAEKTDQGSGARQNSVQAEQPTLWQPSPFPSVPWLLA